MPPSRLRPRAVVRAAAVPMALLAGSLLVWQGSYAAFSSSTTAPASSWTTGDVALSDDDAGVAMFTTSLLKPGSTGMKCLVVTSSSTVYGPVRLYATGLSTNTLSTSATSGLQLSIEIANPGSFTNSPVECATLTGTTSIYSGTVSGLSAASTWATGLGGWTPTAVGQTRVYRFRYTVPAAATSSIAGQTATATFTWETRV